MVNYEGKAWKQVYSAWNYTNSIAGGGGRYVAIGKNGFILTSADLTNWKAVAPFTGNKLNSIAWDGRKFITVGEKGVIYTSADGIKWIKCLSPTDKDLYRIIIGTSETGKDWTDNNPYRSWFEDILYDYYYKRKGTMDIGEI